MSKEERRALAPVCGVVLTGVTGFGLDSLICGKPADEESGGHVLQIGEIRDPAHLYYTCSDHWPKYRELVRDGKYKEVLHATNRSG